MSSSRSEEFTSFGSQIEVNNTLRDAIAKYCETVQDPEKLNAASAALSRAFNVNPVNLPELVTNTFEPATNLLLSALDKIEYDSALENATQYLPFIENDQDIKPWLLFIKAYAINQLLDHEGNVREDIYRKINIDNKLTSIYKDRANLTEKFKQSLLSGYVTNILGFSFTLTATPILLEETGQQDNQLYNDIKESVKRAMPGLLMNSWTSENSLSLTRQQINHVYDSLSESLANNLIKSSEIRKAATALLLHIKYERERAQLFSGTKRETNEQIDTPNVVIKTPAYQPVLSEEMKDNYRREFARFIDRFYSGEERIAAAINKRESISKNDKSCKDINSFTLIDIFSYINKNYKLNQDNDGKISLKKKEYADQANLYTMDIRVNNIIDILKNAGYKDEKILRMKASDLLVLDAVYTDSLAELENKVDQTFIESNRFDERAVINEKNKFINSDLNIIAQLKFKSYSVPGKDEFLSQWPRMKYGLYGLLTAGVIAAAAGAILVSGGILTIPVLLAAATSTPGIAAIAGSVTVAFAGGMKVAKSGFFERHPKVKRAAQIGLAAIAGAAITLISLGTLAPAYWGVITAQIGLSDIAVSGLVASAGGIAMAAVSYIGNWAKLKINKKQATARITGLLRKAKHVRVLKESDEDSLTTSTRNLQQSLGSANVDTKKAESSPSSVSTNRSTLLSSSRSPSPAISTDENKEEKPSKGIRHR